MKNLDWQLWLSKHQATLRAIGLPVDVYMSQSHWLDFLENGHLHWHPEEDTGFDFSNLNVPQQRHLLRYLEAEIENEPIASYIRCRIITGTTEKTFPLIEYLRHLVGATE